MKLPLTPIGRLRAIGLAEGVSFLVLLGIAMPLKYLAGAPLAVKVVGWVHGVLFVLFCIALWDARRSAPWPWSRAAGLLVAALLPFGPFVIEGRLRREDRPIPMGSQGYPSGARGQTPR